MANIQDVAKLAGVSISTVSRVLNRTAYVDPDREHRVLDAIQKLQYQPNRAARALRANYSRIIGLLITDIQNPFFTALIRGVEDIAQSKKYSVILCNSDEDVHREQQYIEVLCAERVAGCIVVPIREQAQILTPFQQQNIPVVLVDRNIKKSGFDAVMVNNRLGAYEAVTHLIANGYRRIGIVCGPLKTTTGRERLTGYRQALQDAGYELDPRLERIGSFKLESGEQLTRELLELEEPIDALFVCNNLMTLGALNAIQKHELHIPNDIAIVGFDEMPWANLSSISLTTVTQPAYDIGNTAALRLFQRLENPTAFSEQEIILNPRLTLRNSSNPHVRNPNLPDTIELSSL